MREALVVTDDAQVCSDLARRVFLARNLALSCQSMMSDGDARVFSMASEFRPLPCVWSDRHAVTTRMGICAGSMCLRRCHAAMRFQIPAPPLGRDVDRDALLCLPAKPRQTVAAMSA